MGHCKCYYITTKTGWNSKSIFDHSDFPLGHTENIMKSANSIIVFLPLIGYSVVSDISATLFK